jgi:hypothetical protein
VSELKRIQLTIDGQTVCAEPGTTIHAAAAAAGIRIPTLCWKPGFHAGGSCMVCAVEAVGRPGFIPACAAVVEEGLQIRTATESVQAARRTALELLLSDHAGDCEGLCRRACPAGLDIPDMIRHLAAGRMAEAAATVWETIAFPAILGRICPAPCEKACRRGAVDEPVSICLLKRRVGDWTLMLDPPADPIRGPATNRRAAVIGAGPAGLAAAFEWLRAGQACVIFDEHPEPGGGLLDPALRERLPPAILRAELARLDRMGAVWRLGQRVEGPAALAAIRAEYDVVILAPGGVRMKEWAGVCEGAVAPGQAAIFSAGGPGPTARLAVRAMAEGRRAARAAARHGAGCAAPREEAAYFHQAGRLSEEEIKTLLSAADPIGRQTPAADGLSDDAAHRESGRCLQCDCRRKTDCRLDCSARRCDAYASHLLGRALSPKAPRRPRRCRPTFGLRAKPALWTTISSQVPCRRMRCRLSRTGARAPSQISA